MIVYTIISIILYALIVYAGYWAERNEIEIKKNRQYFLDVTKRYGFDLFISHINTLYIKRKVRINYLRNNNPRKRKNV